MDIIDINEYRYVLAFNDTDECHLFKSEDDAKKEAVKELKDGGNSTTEVYLLEVNKIRVMKLELKEDWKE